MARKPRPKPKKPEQVEVLVRGLLEQPLDDSALREHLEGLATEAAFRGLTHIWGPALYRRNRVLFRPFILNQFAEWDLARWGPHAAALDPWLEEVDRRDDAELFRRLYTWKHAQGWAGRVDEKLWRADLLARFQAAHERHERSRVLNKFDLS